MRNNNNTIGGGGVGLMQMLHVGIAVISTVAVAAVAGHCLHVFFMMGSNDHFSDRMLSDDDDDDGDNNIVGADAANDRSGGATTKNNENATRHHRGDANNHQDATTTMFYCCHCGKRNLIVDIDSAAATSVEVDPREKTPSCDQCISTSDEDYEGDGHDNMINQPQHLSTPATNVSDAPDYDDSTGARRTTYRISNRNREHDEEHRSRTTPSAAAALAAQTTTTTPPIRNTTSASTPTRTSATTPRIRDGLVHEGSSIKPENATASIMVPSLHPNTRQARQPEQHIDGEGGTDIAVEPTNTQKQQVTDRAEPSSSDEDNGSSDRNRKKARKNKRYVEMLVHNVSHTDMVLGIQLPKTTAAAEKQHGTPSKDKDGDDTSNPSNLPEHCLLCRPRFSCFDKYSQQVVERLEEAQQQQERTTAADSNSNSGITEDMVVSFPRYERQVDSPRRSICKESTGVPVATGFVMKDINPNDHETNPDTASSPFVDLREVRVRGLDQSKLVDRLGHSMQQQSLDGGQTHDLRIKYVFFPLLATLLPCWRRRLAEKQYTSEKHQVKRILFLVSGVGSPRNWTHSMTGNSTRQCTDLMQQWLAVIEPDVTVVRIHSETNIFRYDENLVFVEKDLMPAIHAYRDAHAKGLPYPDERQRTLGQQRVLSANHRQFDADWRNSFSVTLSLADGSPARTYAIQASLRPYKPTYFHLWQLKTFWHETKIVDDDIEVHSFEEMETRPAVDASKFSSTGTSSSTEPDEGVIASAIKEMKAFRDDMAITLQSQSHDLDNFWLRKTRKPVLAVLLVQSPSMEQPKMYRGTNMEVSMPTGSLCAERNVIGSALADNPSLKRQDLKCIAVLAVPLTENLVEVPCTGSTAATAAAAEKTTTDAAGGSSAGTAHSTTMRRVPSVASYTSIVVEGEGSSVTRPERRISVGSENDSDSVDASYYILDEGEGNNSGVGGSPSRRQDRVLLCEEVGAGKAMATAPSAAPSQPLRHISLFSKSSHHHTSKRSNRTVVVHSTNDLNPLRPCGACNEWLKKIAESNPYFRILTFTDADCHGVYVEPCSQD